MADKKDFESVKAQLEVEKFPKPDGSVRLPVSSSYRS